MSRSNHKPSGPVGENHVMTFGRHRGCTVKEIAENDPEWLIWANENTDLDVHAEIIEKIENKFRPVDWYDVYQLQDKGLLPKN